MVTIGNKFHDMQETLRRLEWAIDLRYDCLMQVLSEEIGHKEAQSLHRKAIDRFASISETPTQPQSTEKEGKRDLREQDYWRDN
jgi:hypothetical protein